MQNVGVQKKILICVLTFWDYLNTHQPWTFVFKNVNRKLLSENIKEDQEI